MEDKEDEMTIGIAQPKEMKKTLFPHQLSAISMMETRETNNNLMADNFCIQTNVSIFADMAGYGKTLSIIGLILRNKMIWDLCDPFLVSNICNIYGNGSITKKTLLRFQKIATTLIVASTSILKQWGEEISTTPLRWVIITTRKRLDNLEPTLYDIVLCSPALYNYLVNKFPNYAWKRFIYDEPTQTKIPAMRCIVAGFTWFVTATPTELLYQNHNNHNFLQSLFSNCMDYHIFQNLIVKNPDSFVKYSFSLPLVNHVQHKSHQPLLQIVNNILSENICNMIDAGNIEKAVKCLGGSSTSNIFELIRNEKEELLKESEFKIQKFTRLQDPIRVNKWKERQAQLQEEISKLDRRFQEFIVNENCHICLGPVDHPVLLICCQNAYCGRCIVGWLKTKNTCPMCRSFVSTDKIIYLSSPAQDQSEPIPNESVKAWKSPRRKQSKPLIILQIIEEKPEGKFIIFSSFDETFALIRHALHDEGIVFVEITGTMETRSRNIEAFKHGNKNVLFINSVSNGAGINLQEATDIILYHRVCDNLERQIIGRAQRIGRTRPLTVHHLL